MNAKIIRPKEKYLWKYLDLYKFISFLNTKELFFSCLNDFEDVLESSGKLFTYYLRSQLQIAEMKPELRNPKIESHFYEDKAWNFLDIIENLKNIRSEYFANCFYASENESVAMWNLYSSNQGIALCYDSKSLLDFIEYYYIRNLSTDYFLTADKIKYDIILNHRIYTDNGELKKWKVENSPFVKDEAYQHENEYRIVLQNRNNKTGRPIIKIDDFKKIDFNIYVHADLEDWKIKLTNGLLIEAGIDKEVQKSKIITSKLVDKYKTKYLEKIVKEKGSYS